MTKPLNESSRKAQIKVLAVSTYELGHQPLVLARLASTFETAMIGYSICDNSVANRTFTNYDDFLLDDKTPPTHLFISVPMHTATQLGKTIANRARAILGNSVQIIAVGLYANVALAATSAFNTAIVSQESAKILDILGIDPTDASPTQSIPPDRTALPGLQNYAHLISGGEKKLSGYVETTIGCAHLCKHCPVPVVFHGKFKAVPSKLVIEQINQLYEEGARHITFGDPDFLNGPAHALKIARAMHKAHPDMTFDATVKVEHILEQREIWSEFKDLGLVFVVSAFEHTSDLILSKLGKGHTRSDIISALELLRVYGIEVRPSLMPFTPWTDRASLIDLIEFLFDYELLESVDPVQLSIRLLVPLESLILTVSDTEIGPWNSELLSYQWHSRDQTIDELQFELATIAEESQARELNAITTFTLMRDSIYRHFNLQIPLRETSSSSCGNKPRLSESWFCCAEPTRVQFDRLG
ncbi:MAG: radical SAM protein [Acidimicrobiaceae bacterium]|nr:radical SAM protein [Acidimicrobiaceae bacterium]